MVGEIEGRTLRIVDLFRVLIGPMGEYVNSQLSKQFHFVIFKD
jgi:hypothetical protein